MIKYEVLFLESAKIFLDDLDSKSRDKVLFTIWKSRETNDPELFKSFLVIFGSLGHFLKASKLDY
jgi:hypothetical protein